MAFTFSINGHTYTSDPTNTGVAAGYHFDGYNYMTALGNLCGDLVAVAAAVVSDKNTTAGSASAAAASADSSAASASTATTQAGLATSNGAAQVDLATTQANNSSASAAAALASQNLAADWADKLTEVVAGRYSAKYWADQAQASVTGQLVYRGGWDASANTYPPAPVTGDFYKVSVAGAPGGVPVNPNDDLIYNGTTWDVIDNTESTIASASQAEMEAGTEAALRAVSPLRVAQAIAALSPVPNVSGGATETVSAVDITLTSASTRVQSVAMTVAGKSVTLPDATTLSTGGALFAIKNNGLTTFGVRGATGNLLGVIGFGQIAVIYLVNNATSSGEWAISFESTTSSVTTNNLLVGTAVTLQAISSSYPALVRLTSSTALAFFRNNNISAAVLTVSGTTLSVGAVQVLSATSSWGFSASRLSDTKVILTYGSGSNDLFAMVVSVSGDTVTAGTPLSLDNANTNHNCVTALSDTKALAVWQGAASFAIQSKVLTISGTDVTAGTIVEVGGGSAETYASVSALSLTTAILVYNLATGTNLAAKVLTVSGTSVSAGSILNLSNYAVTGAVEKLNVAALSATQAMLVCSNITTSYLKACTLDIAGTTVTAGTALVVNAVASTEIGLAKITSTQIIAAYRNDATGYLQSCTLNVNGTTVTANAVSTLNAETSYWTNVIALSSSVACVIHTGTSDYPKARAMEITA